MTTSAACDVQWPTLEGRQQAEHLLCDEGDQTEADKAVTLATRVRKAQLPWQEDTLRGILALDNPDQFTHPTAIIIACRQNGKTLSAAELRILYGAFTRHETIVYSAQRWLTAKSVYLRLKRLINSRPSLKMRAGGWLCSQGVAGFTVRHDDGTESVVMFITRSGDFRGPDEIDLVIYDEAYNLTDNAMAAISPTQLAAKNPQTIYLSSAVNQQIHANGEVLSRLRGRALEAIKTGQKRLGLYYAEYMAPEPSPMLTDGERRRVREDPATWKIANPSYGVIQTETKVRKLLTELSERDFEVEILGWGDWPVDANARPALINLEKWQGNQMVSPTLIGSRTIALDREASSGKWIILAAQHTDAERIYLEVGYFASASSLAVVEAVLSVAAALDPVALVIESKSEAAALKPDLIAAGIEPTLTTSTEYGVACGGFLNDAVDGRLAHGNQRLLSRGVANAEKHELPRGGFLWELTSGYEFLRAATLARWALLEFGQLVKTAPPPAFSTELDDKSGELDVLNAAF